MAFPSVLSADEAARLIPDGAIVTVSSSSGLGCHTHKHFIKEPTLENFMKHQP